MAEVIRLRGQGEDEMDIDRLVALVQQDAAAAAYVLKVANSASMGLRREVRQIERAITLLGAKMVCNIVMSIGMRETFAQLAVPEMQDIYQYVMQTSVAAATFARILALRLGSQLPETAFAAGLLHQTGRLILLFNAPVAYPDLWYSAADPSPIPRVPTTAAETARFGRDYTEIGARVAGEWRFPKALVAAIRHHRCPEEAEGYGSRQLALMTASAHHAAMSLYAVRPGAESAFFGLSAPLSSLARDRNVPAQTLINVLVERRAEVRQYSDAIVPSA